MAGMGIQGGVVVMKAGCPRFCSWTIPEQLSHPHGTVWPSRLGAWDVFGVSIFPLLRVLPPGPVIRGIYITILCPHQELHGILSPFTMEGTSGFGPAPLCAELP